MPKPIYIEIERGVGVEWAVSRSAVLWASLNPASPSLPGQSEILCHICTKHDASLSALINPVTEVCNQQLQQAAVHPHADRIKKN